MIAIGNDNGNADTMIALYDDPAQMEPLVIDSSRPAFESLVGLASELVEASARLDASIPPKTGEGLSELVAGMNCYYSNLIEGHHTLPADIEKALHAVFGKPDQQQLQTLAFAHIEADRWARQQLIGPGSISPFLLEVHRRFCEHLPGVMLTLSDGSRMEPGRFRTRDVSVGRHVAPSWETLERFLSRYASVFEPRLERARTGGIHKLSGIVDAIAAHHRLAWIHPFPDGNGRVTRILVDAMLRTCGLNPDGLWSTSRGFAKTHEQYKMALAGADEHRHGDLDGRGNLTEKGLVAFCTYALETAIDQARFMERLFALGNMEKRCQHYFRNVRLDLKPETAYLYIAAFRSGEFERMEAGRITGLPERTARDVLAALLDEGFLVSDSPRGKVRVGFPIKALGTLLPNLYPAGDLDFPADDLKTKPTRKAR
jgi:Fic family protein